MTWIAVARVGEERRDRQKGSWKGGACSHAREQREGSIGTISGATDVVEAPRREGYDGEIETTGGGSAGSRDLGKEEEEEEEEEGRVGKSEGKSAFKRASVGRSLGYGTTRRDGEETVKDCYVQ